MTCPRVFAIEHSRIFALYWLERVPGIGDCFLYKDSENEFVYIAQRRKSRIVRRPQPATTEDATLWESELPQHDDL